MQALIHTDSYIQLAHRNLHVHRIHAVENGNPLLFIHGALEDGRIFYTLKNKGLAPFLAAQGFDCYIADMGARGKSEPHASSGIHYGHKEAIEEDIPALINYVLQQSKQEDLQLIAHSWGGVLALAYLGLYNSAAIKSMVLFGSKRRITVAGLKKWWMVDVLWLRVCPWMAKRYGYLPVVKYKFGAEDEPAQLLYDINSWILPKSEWKDAGGFDYAKALCAKSLPPVLYFAGSNDPYLGHPTDVKLLAEETGADNYQFSLLSKKSGHLHDYGHIDMLTHPDAAKDHFLEALEWLNSKA